MTSNARKKSDGNLKIFFEFCKKVVTSDLLGSTFNEVVWKIVKLHWGEEGIREHTEVARRGCPLKKLKKEIREIGNN